MPTARAIALVVPAIAGYLLARMLPAPSGAARPSRLLRVCLATGWGLGASSCTFFAWLVLAGAPGHPYFVAESALFAGLGAAVAVATMIAAAGRARRGAPAPGDRPAGVLRRAFEGTLGGALLVSVGAGMAWFVLFTAMNPHGGWDALAIWNLRARFLSRGGDGWAAAFDPRLIATHLDYPLLVPAAVARGWAYLGREAVAWPATVAAAFLVGTVGLLVSALSLLRGRSQGILAGLALLAAPQLFEWATVQTADIPLAYFFLATVVALATADRAPSPADATRWTALGGMMAGFAAWTKNEGLLFLAVVLATRLAPAAATKRWRACRAEAAALAVGLAPALAAVAWFKVRYAPPSDLFADQGLRPLLARLADPSRHATIGRAFAAEVSRLGDGAVAWLAAYRLLLGGRPRRDPGPGFAAAVPALMLAGYYLVYFATPLDLSWHLRWSLPRLVVQLWPIAVFAVFLGTATPGEALATARPGPASGGPGTGQG